MSAYLCDQDTINAIATYAADHELVADAAQFADLLTLTNVASLRARYAGREFLAEMVAPAKAYRFERVEVSAARTAEAAREYDYQACEIDGYEETLCARLIDRVIQHAANVADLERPGGCGAARVAVIWTAKSSNRKTGPMPVSTIAPATCPSDCPLKRNGCYAEQGNLGFLWRALGEHGPDAAWMSGVARVRSTDWAGYCASVAALPEGTLWRHAQAGDLPHKGGKVDRGRLLALVRANRGRRGFGYTHHNVLQSLGNARLIQSATLAGFTINLSANNLGHADALVDAGVAPVVTVLGREIAGNVEVRTPKGRRVVVCPATYREDVTCRSCGLCQVASRGVIVGFPAHGAGARKAGKVAEG